MDATPKKKMKPMLVVLIALGALALSCPCVGIVSAVAIPAFINYVKRAKTTEARANLGVLEQRVESFCTSRGHYPVAAGPLPASPSNLEQRVDFAADPGFASVGFDPAAPVYFSYAIEAAPGGTDLVARGDLDGDGLTSDFRIHCDAGCTCLAMTVVDELE
jgi:Tfp pilus assembly protein PilE